MKKGRNIAILVALAAGLPLLFQATRVEPDKTSICNADKLTCLEEEYVEMPEIDTARIIQGAVAEAQEKFKEEFLSNLSGKKLWGVDISKYQKNVNWHVMVKRNKPDFVFVKATEGTTIVDKMYATHKRNLEKHDVLHGAYHFMSFSSSGKQQALSFIKHAKLGKGNMVPVLDVEYTNRRMPSKRKVIAEITSFCKTIENHYGVKPIIYTHPHLYNNYLRGKFDDYPLWICDYGNRPRVDWAIWQHTSKARVYGFNGRVDKNVMKSDVRTLESLVML